MHEALVHALRLHVAEAEATEVAGAGRDARERMLGHSFHREGRDELRVPVEVVPDAHVAKLGVIGARQDLQKVVPFGDALVGRPRILQRTQLQLALEVPIRIRSRVLEIVHVVLRGLVERHKGAEQFRKCPCYCSIVAGGPCGDAGELRVHRREAENQAAAAGHDPLEALAKGGVEGHLGGVELHVLDGVLLAPADVAGPVGGVAEGDLKNKAELGGQHFAAVEDPDEVRAHEHGAGARGRDLLGVAPAVRQEALDVPVQPPLLVLQEAVEVRAAVVIGDVLDASAVREDLDAVDETARVRRGELQRRRGGGVAHREAELDALAVHEVHAAGQRDAAHAARGRREDAQGARVVLDVFAALHIVNVGGLQPKRQRLDQLIIYGSSYLLHTVYL